MDRELEAFNLGYSQGKADVTVGAIQYIRKWTLIALSVGLFFGTVFGLVAGILFFT